MRVAFDIHAIGQQATGNETYAENLLAAFLEGPERDVELYLYHSRDVGERLSGQRLRRLRPHWPWVRIPVVTPLHLARDRIDVAHFQYVGPPLSPCATVLTVHDLSFERHPEFFPRAMALRMRALMRLLAHRAAQVIAVSHATRAELLEHYPRLRAERVTVVHNGLPAGMRRVADRGALEASVRRFGLSRPFIVCVGNIGTRKNQRRLVQAFARLAGERDGGHDLVLVGKATHGAGAVFREIAALGLSERVHVTGFVTPAELLALYNLATFSVYPSLYEGFGLPILESMACGTAVLTSAASCMPEIAGEAAQLVDPRVVDALHDALARLLDDAALRERLVAAGTLRARTFTWQRAAQETRAIYRAAAA
jgi:glycosyltransferase involved in cell wall biosynthesis